MEHSGGPRSAFRLINGLHVFIWNGRASDLVFPLRTRFKINFIAEIILLICKS